MEFASGRVTFPETRFTPRAACGTLESSEFSIVNFHQAKARLRKRVAMELKRYPWVLPAATVLSGVATLFALDRSAPALAVVGVLCLVATAYLWGFSTRAFRPPRWPSTSHLQRREYGAVWDTLASSSQAAAFNASGRRSEQEVRESAGPTLRNLSELVGITVQDDVLEIGCGVGRIGRELAPLCRLWTGSDVSKNMLTYASERLGQLGNVRLIQLQGEGLSELAGSSFDVVYCTNMLAHLDEIDRWYYVRDAFRVLRPGGRLFIDTIDIESGEGWAMFVQGSCPALESARPPFMPRFSTAAELKNYANRAGFPQVETHNRPPLVILIARKS
ncbi:MAG TPA: class I SAM-dependent methyltransferase [Bryobacteraceae bacterium]|nr:class I SAM-dependent methyltransferase [Bryobacteraceae bacterium]